MDLLPQDSPDYLRRVEDSLIKCAVDIGMLEANIIHTALVSAKTGYGVENLISSIFNLIKGKGKKLMLFYNILFSCFILVVTFMRII